MPISNFPNGISSYGMPIYGNGIPFTIGAAGKGKIFFVDPTNGNDGNTGLEPDKALASLDRANTLVTTNNQDVVVLSANASHAVPTGGLNVTKNRVHFIGSAGSGGHFGQRARVTAAATVTSIGAIVNTGVGNSFTNMKISSASTVAASLHAFAEGGEFTVFRNCWFDKETDLDETAASDVAMNGDSPMFYDCTFGSTARITATAIIRPQVLLTGGLISGKKCRDAYFENCIFWRKSGGTASVFVYGANATDVERMLLMKDCTFLNNALSASLPAHAVGFGAAQTEGSVILKSCTSVDCTILAEAAVGIFVDGAVPTFATTGVSVAS